MSSSSSVEEFRRFSLAYREGTTLLQSAAKSPHEYAWEVVAKHQQDVGRRVQPSPTNANQSQSNTDSLLTGETSNSASHNGSTPCETLTRGSSPLSSIDKTTCEKAQVVFLFGVMNTPSSRSSVQSVADTTFTGFKATYSYPSPSLRSC